jgi:hypothetical protein
MHKKHSFLLLEVLLAIAVVSLFAAPLMHWPIEHYQSQIRRLEHFEYQRIADWTFSEIKEFLLKEGIPWEKLPAKKQTLTLPLSDAPLVLPRFPGRFVHRSYLLDCRGEKEGIHGEIFRIYQVKVFINEKNKFCYRLLIQKI